MLIFNNFPGVTPPDPLSGGEEKQREGESHSSPQCSTQIAAPECDIISICVTSLTTARRQCIEIVPCTLWRKYNFDFAGSGGRVVVKHVNTQPRHTTATFVSVISPLPPSQITSKYMGPTACWHTRYAPILRQPLVKHVLWIATTVVVSCVCYHASKYRHRCELPLTIK